MESARAWYSRTNWWRIRNRMGEISDIKQRVHKCCKVLLKNIFHVILSYWVCCLASENLITSIPSRKLQISYSHDAPGCLRWSTPKQLSIFYFYLILLTLLETLYAAPDWSYHFLTYEKGDTLHFASLHHLSQPPTQAFIVSSALRDDTKSACVGGYTWRTFQWVLSFFIIFSNRTRLVKQTSSVLAIHLTSITLLFSVVPYDWKNPNTNLKYYYLVTLKVTMSVVKDHWWSSVR